MSLHQAVERSGDSISTAGETAVQPDPERRNVFPVLAARGAAGEATGYPPEQLRLMSMKNICFEYSKLGNCSYGDRLMPRSPKPGYSKSKRESTK